MFDRIVERKRPICVNDGFREASRERQGNSHVAMPEHERDLPFLFLGKNQYLPSALECYIAVEPINVRDKQGVESRKQQQRVLGRLAECCRLFD